MRPLFLALALGLLAVPVLRADVVRPAADFAWLDASGKTRDLKSLRGQPLVVLIAPSPRDWTFRSQVGQLQRAFQRFAANKLVVFAAFTTEGGLIRSNIPIVTAVDGPRVAFLYDVPRGFAIAVIGPDGNLDCLSTRVIPAQRILDYMNASFAIQNKLRSE